MTAAILAGSFPGRSWRKARPLPCKNGGRLVLFRGKKACPLVSDMKRKRPNFDTFVPPTVTLSVAARTSGGDRNQLRKGIIRPLLEDSVYGHILQKCPIQFTNGEAYEWGIHKPVCSHSPIYFSPTTFWRYAAGGWVRTDRFLHG